MNRLSILLARDHVADREIAEGHCRGEREPGLVADAVLGRRRDIARGIQTGDRPAALMDDLSVAVGQEPDRGGAGWMQRDTIERRLFDGAEARIDAARRLGGRKLPLVLAAMEIGIDA